MVELRVFAALAAFVLLALALAERGVKSSLAPLCAVCVSALAATVFGVFGLLPVGGWVFYGLAVAAAGYLVFRLAVQRRRLPALGFGFWFFALAGLALGVKLLAARPEFVSWDEYSTWGTSYKLASLYGEFAATAPVGWDWPATQPPALAALSYLVQFLGGGFLPWQSYFAVDLLLLACIGAMLAPFDRPAKNGWTIALPLGVIAVCTPFLFMHTGGASGLSPAYLDTLPDVLIGVVFAASLVAYYAGRDTFTGAGGGIAGAATGEKRVPRWAAALPVAGCLAVLTLLKEISFAFSMLAAALMFLDLLLAKRGRGVSARAKVLTLAVAAGILLLCAVGAYVLWHAYLGPVVQTEATEVAAVGNSGQVGMLLNGLRELVSPGKSDYFQTVMHEMGVALFTRKVALPGTGAMLGLFFTAISVLAAAITKDAAHRRSCVLFTAFMPLAFAAYYLLIAFTYIYVFMRDQLMTSYERYMLPFYLGWFLAAVFMLAVAAKNCRFVVPGKAALLAGALAACALVWLSVPVGYSVFGARAENYAEERAFSAHVNTVREQLAPDGKTFIVSTGDNGLRWFKYCYEFLPWQVDYSYGGGEFLDRDKQADGTWLTRHVGAGEWEQHLLETGCTTVYIDDADEAFRDEYGGLFADGMDGYFDGETSLYEVETQNGGVVLAPLV